MSHSFSIFSYTSTNFRRPYTYMLTFGIHVDLAFKMTGENAKNNVRDREYVRNATDEKEAATSHYGFF